MRQAHGVDIIEDAAEAHGAEYKGRRVGGLGKCGVFSFYGNKVITTGEGGMLTTNDREFYQRAKRLRDHAMSPQRRYFHEERGFNYRITNLQAALGVAQLERIDDFLDRRSEIMSWYDKEIATTGPCSAQSGKKLGEERILDGLSGGRLLLTKRAAMRSCRR